MFLPGYTASMVTNDVKTELPKLVDQLLGISPVDRGHKFDIITVAGTNQE